MKLKLENILKGYNPILIKEFKRTFRIYFLGILVNGVQANSTVIIVAHRKSTIKNSYKVIYLKDGMVDMIVNR